ncbi:DNA ligase [Marinomonas ushuaiensis DSM 15871]|uniref:DNA ligase n=1 Tax=Marinomonas ushuaiensis DSM 15871 TaxID=1122207 RepID=X7E7A8_9GAMM|nr:DNA ligase [Marinomonas ushuaiensis]ETX11755.1 DNA ligase [Marinomonas ushuaiensis DSM 15871]
MTYLKKWLFIGLLQFPVFLLAQVDVQLATSFSDDVHAEDYLISEKYDGVRAIWTGEQLITRQGNSIHAPAWFTDKWPNVWLDGELWSKRHDFEFIMSTVRKSKPIDSEWRKIHYMIFDAPDKEKTMRFEERSQRYTQIAYEMNLPYVIPIKQFTVANNKALHQLLDEYVQRGAEGLMLHRKSALFESGRTDNLLKLKPHMDAEAKVIEILNGAGKFDGMMGSMLVEMPSGLRFKIGSGFSDEERRSPPKVGDYVTYKYHGFTARGVPRFASFVRLRNQNY